MLLSPTCIFAITQVNIAAGAATFTARIKTEIDFVKDARITVSNIFGFL
jgi:hypothetical protein